MRYLSAVLIFALLTAVGVVDAQHHVKIPRGAEIALRADELGISKYGCLAEQVA